VLWRSLVGNLVLSTDTKIKHGRSVRVYAFCSAKDLGYVGGVTLAVVQTEDKQVELDLETLSQTVGARGRADLYWLTSYPGQPISRDIFLNGHVLRVVDEETMELPQLRNMAVSLTAEQPIFLPPRATDSSYCPTRAPQLARTTGATELSKERSGQSKQSRNLCMGVYAV
jgi:hypothetical protein